MGSGILGTNILQGHGFFGFDPTPNTSIVGSARNAAAGNFTTAPDTNYVAPNRGVLGASTTQGNTQAPDSSVFQSAVKSGAFTAPSTAASNGYTTGDIASLDDSIGGLNSLLGRTDTSLNQGLNKLNSDYQTNVNQQTTAQNQALQDLLEKGQADTQAKQTAYDTINQNAHNGYRSLAQIIGRGAGTGSSAYQELLPSVVGNDISGKRSVADTTYATNAAQLAKAKEQDQNSFASVLADLANQKAQGEQSLRTGVENNKQSILSQIATAQANKAQALGGGYQDVKNATASTQAAIENSRNAVDSFFNQFKAPIVAQQAAVATPDLSTYNVDRANVNAGASPDAADDSNPYAALLKKQLQGAV